MTLPAIPEEYTLPVSRQDWPDLLADWKPILPEAFTPWVLTKFGELFVSTAHCGIGVLRVSGFEYERVANDEKDFREWLVDPDKVTEWFLAPLVDRLEKSGRLLGTEQCYSFVQALGLGGPLSAENVTVLSIRNHFCGWGKVFRQVGGLPPGTEVIVKPQ
jgi:hypothetical protein